MLATSRELLYYLRIVARRSAMLVLQFVLLVPAFVSLPVCYSSLRRAVTTTGTWSSTLGYSLRQIFDHLSIRIAKQSTIENSVRELVL